MVSILAQDGQRKGWGKAKGLAALPACLLIIQDKNNPGSVGALPGLENGWSIRSTGSYWSEGRITVRTASENAFACGQSSSTVAQLVVMSR